MKSPARTNLLLTQVLHLLHPRVLGALDAWSYRIALKHAEKRRVAMETPKAKAPPAFAMYRGMP